MQSTDVADADIARQISASSIITKAVVNQLDRDGVVEIKNVLLPADLLTARQGVFSIYKEGRMIKMNESDIKYRQDVVCWLREEDGLSDAKNTENTTIKPLSAAVLDCIALLRGVAHSLELHGYSRSKNLMVPQQCQLSRYAGSGDAGYRAHRDAARSDDFWSIGLLQW